MSAKITIAHINLAKTFRGGERQTLLLMQELANFDEQFDQILVAHPNGLLSQRASSIQGLTQVFAQTQLNGHRALQRLRPSLLHAHEARAVHWCYLHYLSDRIPYIITRRVQDPVKTSWSTRLTYGSAFRIVAISSWIQAHLKDLGYTHTGLIRSCYDPTTPTLGGPIAHRSVDQGIKLVQVGALNDAHKGQTTAIRALKALPKSVSLTLIGDGEDRRTYEQLAQSLAIAHRLEILPWHNDVLSQLRQFDLFLMPSNHEGLGSVLYDAMAAGLPIIAANVGGIPDLITHNQTGLLFEPRDSEALATCITRLIQTPELAKKLAIQAFKVREKYSPAAMTQNYVALYQEMHSLNRGVRSRRRT